MDFIDKAWRRQTRIELRIVYLLFWKIKTRFLFGLIAVSLFAYAVLVGSYFIFVEEENIFTTGRIPALLNPVTISFIAFCILLILFLDSRGKILDT